MKRMLLSLLCLVALQAHAQEPDIATLRTSIESLKGTSTPTCDARIATASQQNSASLFYSAAVCARDQRMDDLSFFLLAGQMRSVVDMALYAPKDEADKALMADLWGMIFYSFGGTGDDAIFRSDARWNAIVARMAQWHAERPATYTPGWNSDSQPKGAEYAAAIAETWARRKQDLDQLARVMKDETYWAAQQEFNTLQQRNPQGFVEGTPDAARSKALLEQMESISAALE